MRTQKTAAIKDPLEGNAFYNDFDLETWEAPRSCEYRSPFQQDRDRLVHTAAFRRLQGKTQVFLSGEYDFYRTRLTHSLEVGTAYVEYSTSTFTTTAGSHVVKFAGLDLPHTGVTAFFDKVRITGSPKPGFGIKWLIADQLGTPRMIFDESGLRANVKRHDYLPFGEELAANTGLRTTPQGYSTSDGVRQQFTLKERDNETGLDYFEARYFSSTHGRFTSADPSLASAKTGRPESWNRYAYCYNRPLTFIDPDGMDVAILDDKARERVLSTLPEEIREKVKSKIDKNRPN